MKILGLLILCLLPTASIASDTTVSGDVTLLALKTTHNNAYYHDTTQGKLKVLAGLKVSYLADHKVTYTVRLNTEDILDYGFADIRISDFLDSGLRVGRVNKLSGFLGGFGIYADRMNFLPQATSPSRIGRTFFRYDGAQIYLSHNTSNTDTLSMDFTIGEPQLDDEVGLFMPTFFATADIEGFELKNTKPVLLTAIRYTSANWQVFFDVVYAEARYAFNYNNVVPTPFGPFSISQRLSTDKFIIANYKMGLAYALGEGEIMLTYFQQTGTVRDLSNFSIQGQSVGGKADPLGVTLMWRQYVDYVDLFYVSLALYKTDYTVEDARAALKVVPDDIDYTYGISVGYSKDLPHNLTLTGQFDVYQGNGIISAKYQNPITSSKYWAVYSASLSYNF